MKKIRIPKVRHVGWVLLILVTSIFQLVGENFPKDIFGCLLLVLFALRVGYYPFPAANSTIPDIYKYMKNTSWPPTKSAKALDLAMGILLVALIATYYY